MRHNLHCPECGAFFPLQTNWEPGFPHNAQLIRRCKKCQYLKIEGDLKYMNDHLAIVQKHIEKGG